MNLEGDIKKRIIDQLRLPMEDLDPSQSFADLGADSLDLSELLISFEQTFGVRIPPESAQNLRTVGNAVDFILAAQAK
ncbi:MAG: acyl carrier protein [Polyangiaceae bacterium]